MFGAASLLSFGGGTAIVPELHRETVSGYSWLTDQQFADCFGLAQVAPGPSTLLVTLLGYRAAGVAGAVVATLATVIPSSILMALVTRTWLRNGKARWHAALEHGLAPLGVGLVVASGVVVARGVDVGVYSWGITAVATVLLLNTKMNPLFVVTAGGLVGLALLQPA